MSPLHAALTAAVCDGGLSSARCELGLGARGRRGRGLDRRVSGTKRPIYDSRSYLGLGVTIVKEGANICVTRTRISYGRRIGFRCAFAALARLGQLGPH